jgi:hypothetical protein
MCWRSRRGPNLVSKAGGEPRGCCAWPRIPWHSGPHGMAHWRGAEARYLKTICEAVSDEMHLERIAQQLFRQSDSWSGVGEKTRDAPDPPHQRKWSALSWHLTGLASLLSVKVMTASSAVKTFVLSQCRSHKPMNHPVIMLGKKVVSFSVCCSSSWHAVPWCCQILCEKLGTKFCRHTSHSKILHQYYLARAKWQVEFISNLSDHQMSVPTDYCIDTVNSLVGSRHW